MPIPLRIQDSGDKFEPTQSDEFLTIRVPKATFDKAAVELVASLRKELDATKDLLFAKETQVRELQNELNARAMIADIQTIEQTLKHLHQISSSDASPEFNDYHGLVVDTYNIRALRACHLSMQIFVAKRDGKEPFRLSSKRPLSRPNG
ncbi:hypothetical protein VNI00_017468 [Paramarasmius palmivorus]|uniref:Uncharacterized protein n=1 Tax=Paramarasmius palmivorus TaxID=297713 RepID=A0AAW0B6S0_9AGAR